MESAPTLYHWYMFVNQTDRVVSIAPNHYPMRAKNEDGDITIGNIYQDKKKFLIPSKGKEIECSIAPDVIIQSSGTRVRWAPASDGKIVAGAVGPIGKDGTYVGRAVGPKPEGKLIAGRIHPKDKCIYFSWAGKEYKTTQYEVLVIEIIPLPTSPLYQWVKLAEPLPKNAVWTKDDAVIVAQWGFTWTPGKYNRYDKKAYISYDGKEIEVKSEVYVLVNAPGTSISWVPQSDGAVPAGAVGPLGCEKFYIGKDVSGYQTPGKIYPYGKKFFCPQFREQESRSYEALVIKKS